MEPVVFSNPLPPTHKTSGISKIEWARLFGLDAIISVDKLAANINGDLSYLTGNTVNPDDKIDSELLPGIDSTYRDFMRSCLERFKDVKDGVDVSDPLVYPSLICFELFGVLPAGEKDRIILGVPL